MPDGEKVYKEDHSVLKHSGLGIASFIISIVIGMFDFFLVTIAGIVEATAPGGIDEESVVAVAVGLSIFLGFGVSLIGIGLAIAGLIQKNRKKIFPILGLVFNLTIIIVVIGIMIIGITVS